ncbi:RtcB family protein [Vulgatibacter sp.]|uniref:RtcB family protein n=1 Tax=Vulgatibacter sp. TaxID=1971226 RepID=UPI00356A7850
MKASYELIETGARVPIKAWTRGVPVEQEAVAQLRNIASLPFVSGWIAAMPDVHLGIGATVGSVIPTEGAIVPAAVGVDIGCGMMAVRTSLRSFDLPDDLSKVRSSIEAAVPHGRTHRGGTGDRGAWSHPPKKHAQAWQQLAPGFERIAARHPKIRRGATVEQIGTLGSGNHFIEVCLDEEESVWFMLHSGSRGVGNRIGSYFIELAKADQRQHLANLPDRDLAYFREGAIHFDDYVEAVTWAQDYARVNRELMMGAMIGAVRRSGQLPPFELRTEVVNCHHNYVARESHLGKELFITRKGAVRAGPGEMGIIPGSMGARSYVVRGKGNPESFHSCSHGAGRKMSRTEARRRFSLAEHAAATAGIECRKDEGVIDETPGAYKPIEAVMRAQRDLVDIVHELRQVVCVKG